MKLSIFNFSLAKRVMQLQIVYLWIFINKIN